MEYATLRTAKRGRRIKEGLIGGALFLCAAASTLVTVGVVLVLTGETLQFFREVSIVEFLTSTRWEPMFRDQHFGVLPLLAGRDLVGGSAAAYVCRGLVCERPVTGPDELAAALGIAP